MTASLTHMRAEIDEAGEVVERQLAGDAGAPTDSDSSSARSIRWC